MDVVGACEYSGAVWIAVVLFLQNSTEAACVFTLADNTPPVNDAGVSRVTDASDGGDRAADLAFVGAELDFHTPSMTQAHLHGKWACAFD